MNWFVFDLGNVVVKLAYERVLKAVCADSDVNRDELVHVLDDVGGYRDMERGLVSFDEFYEFLESKIRYRGGMQKFRAIWTDFFEGPVEGIEEVLVRVRGEYRVAFLSNSNEVHAEVIPRKFAPLFRREDRFIFSHQHMCAKPDPEIFQRTLKILGAKAAEMIYVDDLLENVVAARQAGILAFQFENSGKLLRQLEDEKLLRQRGSTQRAGV